jgi:hypothetical protein
MAIDTTKVSERRQLHFDNLDEILADVEQLATSKVKALGNWTPGQILEHLAKTMDGSIDGMGFQASWPIRMIAGLFKRRMLSSPMAPGWQLKNESAAALVPPPIECDAALAHFRLAIGRRKAEEKCAPNPVLGTLTREEWTRLHCRHSELHLSFLVPV